MNPLIIVDIFSMVPLFFTIYLATRHLSGSRQNRYYILASYITLVLLALEVLGGYSMAGRETAFAFIIHLLSTALYYILIPAVSLIILWYLGYSDYSKILKGLLSIPLALNAILAILSIQNVGTSQ